MVPATAAQATLRLQSEHLEHTVAVAFARQENDGDFRCLRLAPEHLEHLRAARHGHLVIEQDEVGLVVRDIHHRLRAARHDGHAVLAREPVLDRLEERLVVIDDENVLQAVLRRVDIRQIRETLEQCFRVHRALEHR